LKPNELGPITLKDLAVKAAETLFTASEPTPNAKDIRGVSSLIVIENKAPATPIARCLLNSWPAG